MASRTMMAPHMHSDSEQSAIDVDVVKRVYSAAATALADTNSTERAALDVDPDDLSALRDNVERVQRRADAASSAVKAALREMHGLRVGETYAHNIRIGELVAKQSLYCLDSVAQKQLQNVQQAAVDASSKAKAWLRRIHTVHAAEMQDMKDYAAELQDRATQLYDDDAGSDVTDAAASSGTAPLPGAQRHAAGVYAQFLMAMRNTQADHDVTFRDAVRHVQDELLHAQVNACEKAHIVVTQAATELREDVRRAAHKITAHMAAAQNCGSATYAHVDVAAAWRRMLHAAGAVNDAMTSLRALLDSEFALAIVHAATSPR